MIYILIMAIAHIIHVDPRQCPRDVHESQITHAHSVSAVCCTVGCSHERAHVYSNGQQ